MIGVIGAPDSIRLVQDVAEELGWAGSLVLRPYRIPNEAADLARGLQSICQVILFTGRVPYVLASGSEDYRIPLEYIPHSGLDLYRALATLLLRPEYKDELPRISIDSIPASEVAEVFEDLELEPPPHVLPIEFSEGGADFDLEELAHKHVRLFREGTVDICLTSIAWVHRQLRARRVRCLRIDHPRLVIRESLQRAQIVVRLGRAAEFQVAVCMIADRSGEASGEFVDAVSRRFVDMLGGKLVRTRSSAGMIVTTRGAVDRFLRFELGSRSSPLRTEIRARVSIGFGIGTSAGLAEENARKALKVAGREGLLALADEDGMITFESSGAAGRVTRATPAAAELASRLKLSPTLIERLENVVHSIDPQHFSVIEFAEAEGILPRSARRILAILLKQGIVEPGGFVGGVGAGRPRTIYRFQRGFLEELAGPPR